MQISVLSSGVDTVSDPYPQVRRFKSRGCSILSLFFKFNRTWSDVILRFRKSHRVTQVPNGLRKYPAGYATSDSLPFSSHHSIDHDTHQVFVDHFQQPSLVVISSGWLAQGSRFKSRYPINSHQRFYCKVILICSKQIAAVDFGE